MNARPMSGRRDCSPGSSSATTHLGNQRVSELEWAERLQCAQTPEAREEAARPGGGGARAADPAPHPRELVGRREEAAGRLIPPLKPR